jgi:hypothetical protein
MTTRPRQLDLAASGAAQHVLPNSQSHGPAPDPTHEAIIGQLDMAVVVVTNRRVIATNTAGRRLLHAGLETIMSERRFRRLLATLDGSDTPIEQELAIPSLTPAQPPLRLHLRLSPLHGGAVLEFTRAEVEAHHRPLPRPARPLTPTIASARPAQTPESGGTARLAERIRHQSARLTGLVDDFLALTDPGVNPELVDGLLVPSSGVFACRGVSLDIDAHTATVHGNPVTLPLRQFDLLKILLANAGRVVSRQQLVRLIWPQPPVDSSNTIDVHIRRLRRNLDPDRSGASCIISVRKVGYMFATADAPGPHHR